MALKGWVATPARPGLDSWKWTRSRRATYIGLTVASLLSMVQPSVPLDHEPSDQTEGQGNEGKVLIVHIGDRVE